MNAAKSVATLVGLDGTMSDMFIRSHTIQESQFILGTIGHIMTQKPIKKVNQKTRSQFVLRQTGYLGPKRPLRTTKVTHQTRKSIHTETNRLL